MGRRPVIATCNDLTKSGTQAVFLAQVVSLLKSSKITREGVLWTVGTRGEWMDKTKLTDKQVKYTLKKLREAGLIEVRIWPHPVMRNTLKSTWVTLKGEAARTFDLGLKEDVQLVQKCTNQSVQTWPNQLVQTWTNLLYIDYSNTTVSPQGGKGESMKNNFKGLSMEQIKQAASMKPKKVYPEKVTVTGAYEVMRAAYAEKYGEFFAPLGGAAKGRLKHLMEATPSGSFFKLLEQAVLNWEEFVEFAYSMSGLDPRPEDKVANVFTISRYKQAFVEFKPGKMHLIAQPKVVKVTGGALGEDVFND